MGCFKPKIFYVGQGQTYDSAESNKFPVAFCQGDESQKKETYGIADVGRCIDIGEEHGPSHDGVKRTVVGILPRREFWQFIHT